MAYHEGELAVQELAGARKPAARIAGMIRDSLSPGMQAFVADQRVLYVSSIDPQGRVWVSPVSGPQGFAEVMDAETLRVAPTHMDTLLAANIRTNSAVGVLAITLATRDRIRINGVAVLDDAGVLWVKTEEVFGNCQKYIQARTIVSDADAAPALVQRGDGLTDAQQTQIAQADTFFIGSYHQAGGADASHRGGRPGFVHVLDPQRLAFPDYLGNMMFQTLGNISANPHAGLLFPDFATGATLQLTGQAQILWDWQSAAQFAGAKRVVEFAIEEVIEQAHAIPLRWEFVSYSPFDPK